MSLVAVIGSACGSSDPAPKLDAGSDDAGQGLTLDGGGNALNSACQDDDGFLPSCDAINGLGERQCDRAACDRYVARLKTRVARNAIDCMKQHIIAGDSCRPCSGVALAEACTDPNAQAACASLNTECPARSATDCIPLISGLTFGGRINFVTCVTEDNCGHDLPSCLP